MKKEEKYTIYKVENIKTGYVYIGATTRSLEDRKQDHLKKVSNNSDKPLHQAMSTYGAEAFTWECVDTATTNNELAEKEVNYICEFGKKTTLYNQTRGGDIPKEVYQYDVDSLKLIAKHSCLKEAARVINSNKKALSKACLSVNQKLGGFYWSYKTSFFFLPVPDNRQKRVFQYSIKEKLLNTFKSVSEANKYTKVNKTSIAKACRGERKSAGGFSWKYQ